MKTAVIILGHGSRSGDADQSIRKVADALRTTLDTMMVEHAFLQYMLPTAQEVLDRCIAQKADRIVIVPFFLQAGAHVTKDIPALVREAQRAYPGVTIVVTGYVGEHPLMGQIVKDLVQDRR